MNRKAIKEKIFSEIYESHWLKLYLHLLKMLEDEDDAKDVVQEVFANLWNNFDSIDVHTSYTSYLYGAVRKRAINYLAHKKIVVNHEQSQQIMPFNYFNAADGMIIEKELAAQINSEIDKLPSKMGIIFKKSRFENKSYKQISEELNIAENTVRKQVSTALRLMREKFLHLKYYFLFL